MTTIPDDLKQAAITAWNESSRMSIRRVGHPWEPIARAILAERERCAAIADARADAYAEIANRHEGTPIGESNTMRCGAAAAIAAAIRGGSHE